jgi:glycosyltransferase involved in cell wall biosynthesis
MSERTEPLVSVVTPFYNTAPYLAECIESVLRQTHRNLEYILVDNQSTDGSADIARRYAEQDRRIRLERNATFLNQVQNYNRGLSLISAESHFTKIVEADNWIYPDCLTQMVAVAEPHPKVGVVGSFCITERTVRFLGLPLAVSVLGGREVARMHFLEDAYLFGAPTTILLRSSIVRNRSPFFDETTWLVEDLSACYELLRDWDFGFVHQVLTFVRTQNEGTIQSGRRRFDTMALDRLAVLTRHGADFLEPAEFRAAYRRTQDFYYTCLARGWVERKGPAFWKYHREGLAEIGKRLEYGRVMLHVLGMGVRAVASPGHYGMAFYRRLKAGRRA